MCVHAVGVAWWFEAEPDSAAKIRGVVVLFRGDALRAPILADFIVLRIERLDPFPDFGGR